jgi:hypothetical protein
MDSDDEMKDPSLDLNGDIHKDLRISKEGSSFRDPAVNLKGHGSAASMLAFTSLKSSRSGVRTPHQSSQYGADSLQEKTNSVNHSNHTPKYIQNPLEGEEMKTIGRFRADRGESYQQDDKHDGTEEKANFKMDCKSEQGRQHLNRLEQEVGQHCSFASSFSSTLEAATGGQPAHVLVPDQSRPRHFASMRGALGKSLPVFKRDSRSQDEYTNVNVDVGIHEGEGGSFSQHVDIVSSRRVSWSVIVMLRALVLKPLSSYK